MNCYFRLVLVYCSIFIIKYVDCDNVKEPTVFIAVPVRNKAHILPYFLTLLSNIDYPKKRITLWFRTDHNDDNSEEILEDWVSDELSNYHRIDFETGDESEKFGIVEWSEARFKHLMKLRETALNSSRYYWADYIWFLDCDVLIIDPSALRNLIWHNHVVVSPMLSSNQMYSNFWGGMTESYYYRRTEYYKDILFRTSIGCHVVPMVHSAVLIDLNQRFSDRLTYNISDLQDYNGPVDDIIVFAISSLKADVPLHVCNDKLYGYITVPLEEDESLEADEGRLFNIKLLAYDHGFPLSVNENLRKYLELNTYSLLGLDKIFVINLKRRPEKRRRMEYLLNELGVIYTVVEGFDGSTLNDSDLKSMGIVSLPGYEDPYHERPIKKGEIGCFLSHMNIWNSVVENKYEKVLILEDDISVSGDFKINLRFIMEELSTINWDLVYLGRKILNSQQEKPVEDKQSLVYPEYSYWSLAYLLTYEGAIKLLKTKPLNKIVPVDEYLPIMYNKHPRSDWAQHFPERNLVALSVRPLIVHPMKYLNEQGYVSDTEDSSILDADPAHVKTSTVNDEL